MQDQATPLELHLPLKKDSVAIETLSDNCNLSKQRIKQAMLKGAVWLTHKGKTQRVRRAKKNLRQGDSLHIYYDERILSTTPPTPQLICDAQSYSVWYKPYGMLSQGSKWGDHCTINRWAEQHLQPQRPSFIVHRLDRAATGLILVAHKKSAAAALSGLFQKREMDKRYRVIVNGSFPKSSQFHTISSPIDGRSACSKVQLVEYDPLQNRSLLEVIIESGRKHQIRRHLSEMDFPVIGDRLYGSMDKNENGENLQLTAYYLAFKCPISKQEVQFELPENLLPKMRK